MTELNLKFRKKPVVIEAFQFQQPTSVDEAPEWLTEAVLKNDFLVVDGVAHITTLEGIMTAQPGDWIIRGVKGEIYPCKPDIFSATYEPAAPVSTPQQSAQRASVDTLSEAVSVMLWLYRRLPHCYGRPSHVEVPILALAKIAEYKLSFLFESFAERGAAPSPAPQGEQAALNTQANV